MPEYFTDQKISSLGTEEQSNEDERAHKIPLRKNIFKILITSLSKSSAMYCEI